MRQKLYPRLAHRAVIPFILVPNAEKVIREIIPQRLDIAIRRQRQLDRVQAEDILHILVQDAEIVTRGIRPNPPDTAFRQA